MRQDQGLALKATVTNAFLRHRRGPGNVVNAHMNFDAKQLRDTLQLLRFRWTQIAESREIKSEGEQTASEWLYPC